MSDSSASKKNVPKPQGRALNDNRHNIQPREAKMMQARDSRLQIQLKGATITQVRKNLDRAHVNSYISPFGELALNEYNPRPMQVTLKERHGAKQHLQGLESMERRCWTDLYHPPRSE